LPRKFWIPAGKTSLVEPYKLLGFDRLFLATAEIYQSFLADGGEGITNMFIAEIRW